MVPALQVRRKSRAKDSKCCIFSALGQQDAIRLMKAIVANELNHYGQKDLAEDAIAMAGHGSLIHDRTIGFGQIKPDGVKDMSRQLDRELKSHERTSNPLARFEYLNDARVAQELVKPVNTPLFVAAHIAIDLKTLNRHKNELHVSLEALGYFYNADLGYARSDKYREQLMTRKEANAKKISFNPSLPTDTILQRSEHAANIRKWLKKIY